jgi:ABC-2 type transport system ATP-binding protein
VLLRAGRVVADGSVAQVRALAAGRVVSATVPSPDLAGSESLPGVSGVRVEGSRIHLSCDDSDLALPSARCSRPSPRRPTSRSSRTGWKTRS